MTQEEIAVAAVKVAAHLIVAVRDEGPDTVAQVLATAPEGRVDAVAIALAAMIDPDTSIARSLAWTELMAPGSPAFIEHRRLLRIGVAEPQATILAQRAAEPIDLEQLVIHDDLLDLDPVFGASLIGLDPEERKRRVRERERHHLARIDPAGHRAKLDVKAATRTDRPRRPQGVPHHAQPVDKNAKPVYLSVGKDGERPSSTRGRAAAS